jgi:excisionase family DNA binding protein
MGVLWEATVSKQIQHLRKRRTGKWTLNEQPVEDGIGLLNYKQASTFIGVSEGTLQNWVSSGLYQIPHLKIGRLIRFRPASLLRWLETRERNLVATPANEGTLEVL